MEAVREIRHADSNQLTVNIPDEFIEREVEIIVLPYSEKISHNHRTEELMRFDQLVENAKRRAIKIDKHIDIDNLMNEMNDGLC